MYTLDASSIIHAWDNYPKTVFGPLWSWMETKFQDGTFTMPQRAYDECGFMSPDCHEWLKIVQPILHPITSDIVKEAITIKRALGLSPSDPYGSGVDENDLFIIVTAKIESRTLISNERLQSQLPSLPKNYRIPAVCQMPCAKVNCISFVEMLKAENPTF